MTIVTIGAAVSRLFRLRSRVAFAIEHLRAGVQATSGLPAGRGEAP